MRCFKMRGKKGVRHADPADPPRRRGNKARGHGTWENDRPAVAGGVGRDSGQVRLQVAQHTDRATLQPFVEQATQPDAAVYTDEWQGYAGLSDTGSHHATVCHKPGERVGARDDDGDGIREVHDNTLEGLGTGLRNFLRPFRGVSKWFLDQYVAMFEWAYNVKTATDDFLRALLGVKPGTTNSS